MGNIALRFSFASYVTVLVYQSWLHCHPDSDIDGHPGTGAEAWRDRGAE